MVGGTDLLASAGAARLVGKMNPKWAGGVTRTQQVVDGVPVGKAVNAYSPSMPQHIAMGATSIATPIALEPMVLLPQECFWAFWLLVRQYVKCLPHASRGSIDDHFLLGDLFLKQAL
mgnify:CR=1 FL=1